MSGDPFIHLPVFEGFNEQQLALLRPLFSPIDAYAGDELFEQGETARYLYLVVSGEVTIRYKPEDGPALTVTRVRPGGVVGWSAALGSRSYTSGAMCEVYSQLLRISGPDLRNLCTEHPETGMLLLERLASIIAARLRHTHEQVMALLKQGLRSNFASIEE